MHAKEKLAEIFSAAMLGYIVIFIIFFFIGTALLFFIK